MIKHPVHGLPHVSSRKLKFERKDEAPVLPPVVTMDIKPISFLSGSEAGSAVSPLVLFYSITAAYR